MTLEGVAGHESPAGRYVVACGTVTGAEHVRLGRNNQDGVAAGATQDALAVVVTDGCSSGAFSEVGARLAAEWLAAWAPVEWRTCGEDPVAFARALAAGLSTLIRRSATGFGVRSLEGVVADFFLFTFLVGVVGRERAAIVGVGDGVFMVDGAVTVLDAGPDNAPPYVAYEVVGAAHAAEPRVFFSADARDFDCLVVATDGAADLDATNDDDALDGARFSLERVARDARFRRNKSLLHKRLQVVGRRFARLNDDTTVAAILRRPEEATS